MSDLTVYARAPERIDHYVCPRCGEVACPTPTAEHSPHTVGRARIEYVRADIFEALKARLRQEVDAHRTTLHPHALPFTDEEWQGYLGTIPGLEEGR